MRALFPKKNQSQFLNKIFAKIPISKAAILCSCSERTLRDWRREKYLANYDILLKLCEKTKLKLPTNIEIKDNYWYAAAWASAGGKAVFKKYGKVGGSSKYRKRKWREWWEKKGKYKYKFIGARKQIQKPTYSEELAEFVGIILGDGGIGKYQLTITLHSEDDKKYCKFVIELIKILFDVPISVYHRKDSHAVNIKVSRIELVIFCTEKLGLKKGNKIKQQIDIPNWIKRNKKYKIACLRGLIDTDGSIFTHCYKINGKKYSYKKLSFTSRSNPLRQSVFNILQNLKIKSRLNKHYDVRVDSIDDMKKYFQIVGSHNPKHLNRYYK